MILHLIILYSWVQLKFLTGRFFTKFGLRIFSAISMKDEMEIFLISVRLIKIKTSISSADVKSRVCLLGNPFPEPRSNRNFFHTYCDKMYCHFSAPRSKVLLSLGRSLGWTIWAPPAVGNPHPRFLAHEDQI
jgi:hypothetical protein